MPRAPFGYIPNHAYPPDDRNPAHARARSKRPGQGGALRSKISDACEHVLWRYLNVETPTVGRGAFCGGYAEVGGLGAAQVGERTQRDVSGDEIYDREQRVSIQVEE